MKKIIITLGTLLMLGLVFVACSSNEVSDKSDDQAASIADESGPDVLDPDVSVVNEQADYYVVSYLHMNRRCATCEKLEAYSEEAILTGFAQQLKDSSLIWRVENFEDEGNEHLVEKYSLYSQSVLISKITNGQETDWKSLDRIWELVNNKEEFVTYVQSEVTSFINLENR